jgi:dihydroorotase
LAEVGGNLHIGHISTAKTLELIRSAKTKGLKFTCEVTPHHLLGHDCDYRVNPPLASQSDVYALISGIKDGSIDCLSTDHAPHTHADKEAGMAGISNIEYALQIYLHIFYKNDIPLTRLAQMTSFNPRKRLGIGGGRLAAGEDADIIIVDTQKQTVIDKSKMISRSNNTPFDGYAVRGLVEKTIIKGKIRYDNGQFVR